MAFCDKCYSCEFHIGTVSSIDQWMHNLPEMLTAKVCMHNLQDAFSEVTFAHTIYIKPHKTLSLNALQIKNEKKDTEWNQLLLCQGQTRQKKVHYKRKLTQWFLRLYRGNMCTRSCSTWIQFTVQSWFINSYENELPHNRIVYIFKCNFYVVEANTVANTEEHWTTVGF